MPCTWGEPQVVRFTVTLPLPVGAATLPSQWTLLAVAGDPLDPLAAAVGVSDLVTGDRYVAARSVLVVT